MGRASGLLLLAALACAPHHQPRSACNFPVRRTTVRAEPGAILETWQLSANEVVTRELPDVPAFLEYRAAIERDSANVRRPPFDPDAPDERYNNDLVFEQGIGAVEPISCLDALLFARQAQRVSQVDKPTEFIASVLRRGEELLVVFGAGSDLFVPRGWYGFDLVPALRRDGWRYWYVIHNHTSGRTGGRLVPGMPAPSTSDVQLLRTVARELGLESIRVTNGFYTFSGSADQLDRFRSR